GLPWQVHLRALRHHRQRHAAGAGVGRPRHAGVLQHHAAAGKDLRQRGRGADAVLRVGRGLRDFLQGPRRQVPGPARGDVAEDVRRLPQVGRSEPQRGTSSFFLNEKSGPQAALFLTITLPPASLDPVAFQHQPQGFLVALFLLDLHRQVADGGRDPHAQLLVLVAIDAFDTHGLELARRGDDGFPAGGAQVERLHLAVVDDLVDLVEILAVRLDHGGELQQKAVDRARLQLNVAFVAAVDDVGDAVVPVVGDALVAVLLRTLVAVGVGDRPELAAVVAEQAFLAEHVLDEQAHHAGRLRRGGVAPDVVLAALQLHAGFADADASALEAVAGAEFREVGGGEGREQGKQEGEGAHLVSLVQAWAGSGAVNGMPSYSTWPSSRIRMRPSANNRTA